MVICEICIFIGLHKYFFPKQAFCLKLAPMERQKRPFRHCFSRSGTGFYLFCVFSANRFFSRFHGENKKELFPVVCSDGNNLDILLKVLVQNVFVQTGIGDDEINFR